MLQNIRFLLFISVFAVNSVSDVLNKIIRPRLSVHCPLTTDHYSPHGSTTTMMPFSKYPVYDARPVGQVYVP